MFSEKNFFDKIKSCSMNLSFGLTKKMCAMTLTGENLLTWKICISDLELGSPPTMKTRMLLYISIGSLLVKAVGS